MDIAILLFDQLTVLDAVGPYEVFNRVPDVSVRFVATVPGAYRSGRGDVALVADHSLADCPTPEIVLLPGGPGTRAAMEDPRILDWVRTAHRTSKWTTSVCTGSLILGAAGVLVGLRATTHWLDMDELPPLGAVVSEERVVVDGKVVTAAGVSAGIDMALTLVGMEFGDDVAQAMQLILEYDPHPPYSAGSPLTAPAELVARLRRLAGKG